MFEIRILENGFGLRIETQATTFFFERWFESWIILILNYNDLGLKYNILEKWAQISDKSFR